MRATLWLVLLGALFQAIHGLQNRGLLSHRHRTCSAVSFRPTGTRPSTSLWGWFNRNRDTTPPRPRPPVVKSLRSVERLRAEAVRLREEAAEVEAAVAAEAKGSEGVSGLVWGLPGGGIGKGLGVGVGKAVDKGAVGVVGAASAAWAGNVAAVRAAEAAVVDFAAYAPTRLDAYRQNNSYVYVPWTPPNSTDTSSSSSSGSSSSSSSSGSSSSSSSSSSTRGRRIEDIDGQFSHSSLGELFPGSGNRVSAIDTAAQQAALRTMRDEAFGELGPWWVRGGGRLVVGGGADEFEGGGKAERAGG
ncbi:hypothetical protein B484DRAFT_392938, partial [Ochromonadaceae sp. CCMP2298]